MVKLGRVMLAGKAKLPFSPATNKTFGETLPGEFEVPWKTTVVAHGTVFHREARKATADPSSLRFSG
jgi:hypothetical protein